MHRRDDPVVHSGRETVQSRNDDHIPGFRLPLWYVDILVYTVVLLIFALV